MKLFSKKKVAITRLSIGRVYNLGNYEHVRYELTVDVPEGESAAQALTGAERIIAALRPRRDVKSVEDLERQARYIMHMKEQTEDDFWREHTWSAGTRAEIIGRYEAEHEADKARRAEALAVQAKAHDLLDDLGGAARFKDAKLDWDYED